MILSLVLIVYHVFKPVNKNDHQQILEVVSSSSSRKYQM